MLLAAAQLSHSRVEVESEVRSTTSNGRWVDKRVPVDGLSVGNETLRLRWHLTRVLDPNHYHSTIHMLICHYGIRIVDGRTCFRGSGRPSRDSEGDSRCRGHRRGGETPRRCRRGGTRRLSEAGRRSHCFAFGEGADREGRGRDRPKGAGGDPCPNPQSLPGRIFLTRTSS